MIDPYIAVALQTTVRHVTTRQEVERNLAHIGNARPVVVFDTLFRLLQTHYDKVVYARNITDVDDKIIKAAREGKCSIESITSEFIAKYRAAQEARNHRITDWCYEELDRLSNHGMTDRAFNMYRTWADLRLMDGTIDPSEREVGRCYAGDPKKANFSPRGIGLNNTLRTWLSMWSLRDSHCRGAAHLTRITQPALVVQSTADTGVFPSDAQAIYNALGSSDKNLHMIPGDHYLEKPANARDDVADMIVDWIRSKGS